METIKIKSGHITISDPCYDLGTWCQAEKIPFPNGEYYVDCKRTNEGDWGVRNAELSIYNKEKVPMTIDKESQIIWKEIKKEIGVDSGQAGIFDSKYYEQYHFPTNTERQVNEDWYDKVCNITLEEEGYGIIDEEGCVSSSGYGDGGYTAYLGYLNDELVAVKVIFIDESEEQPEDEDWTECDIDEEDY